MVGLLGRCVRCSIVGDPGRRVEVEVGDQINNGLIMDQPEEVEVGRRSSLSLFLSKI